MCALVSGVQTCALPIFSKQASSTAVTCSPNRLVTLRMEMIGFFWLSMSDRLLAGARLDPHGDDSERQRQQDQHRRGGADFRRQAETRSDERRVGEGWVRTCRTRWSRYH